MACRPYTREEFLEVWRAVLPASYTESIETAGDGEGMDVPALQSAIFSEFEVRLHRTQQAYFLRRHSNQTDEEAGAAGHASGSVLVARAAPTLGSMTIAVGTRFLAVVTDSYGDRLIVGRYLATQATELVEGDPGPITVPIRAEWPGYDGNIGPGLVTEFEVVGGASVPVEISSSTTMVERTVPTEANDTFTPAMVGRFFVFSGALASENAAVPRRIVSIGAGVVEFAPPLSSADVGAEPVAGVKEWAELGLSVSQPVAIIGGRVDSLGAIASERGTARRAGETDQKLSRRLQLLDDTISPAALERLLERVLSPHGIRWSFRETRDTQTLMGFTWDVHPYDFGEVCQIDKLVGSQYVGQGGVWMSEGTAVRTFVVCVSYGNHGETGFAYDATNPQTYAPNAYDLTGPGGFYDGRPVEYGAVLGQLSQELAAAKAAGVKFLIMRDPNL